LTEDGKNEFRKEETNANGAETTQDLINEKDLGGGGTEYGNGNILSNLEDMASVCIRQCQRSHLDPSIRIMR
jgi:hypothetical protein